MESLSFYNDGYLTVGHGSRYKGLFQYIVHFLFCTLLMIKRHSCGVKFLATNFKVQCCTALTARLFCSFFREYASASLPASLSYNNVYIITLLFGGTNVLPHHLSCNLLLTVLNFLSKYVHLQQVLSFVPETF